MNNNSETPRTQKKIIQDLYQAVSQIDEECVKKYLDEFYRHQIKTQPELKRNNLLKNTILNTLPDPLLWRLIQSYLQKHDHCTSDQEISSLNDRATQSALLLLLHGIPTFGKIHGQQYDCQQLSADQNVSPIQEAIVEVMLNRKNAIQKVLSYKPTETFLEKPSPQ